MFCFNIYSCSAVRTVVSVLIYRQTVPISRLMPFGKDFEFLRSPVGIGSGLMGVPYQAPTQVLH